MKLFLIAALFATAANASVNTAPTGNDVIQVQLPDTNSAINVSGCTVFMDTFNHILDGYCQQDVGAAPVSGTSPSNNATLWGGVSSPNFYWDPNWGYCKQISMTALATYTAYVIECKHGPRDSIFVDGMGEP
jgi:hypothetical protein